VLEQRCIIQWGIPRAELEIMLASSAAGQDSKCSSSAIYLAGTGIELLCESSRNGDATNFGLFVGPTSYTQHGTVLCKASLGFPCSYSIDRQKPGQAEWVNVWNAEATLPQTGWGIAQALTATTPADLEPYLVDGCLKVKATISLIRK
jgi:hypothetical protein